MTKSQPSSEDIENLYALLGESLTNFSSKSRNIAALAWYLIPKEEQVDYIKIVFSRIDALKEKTSMSIFKAIRSASKKDFLPKSTASSILSKSFVLFSEDDWREYCRPAVAYYAADFEDGSYDA